MKNFKLSTFSYNFMILGSRHFNPGIWGLENLPESRDFGIGIVLGFIPREDAFTNSQSVATFSEAWNMDY